MKRIDARIESFNEEFERVMAERMWSANKVINHIVRTYFSDRQREDFYKSEIEKKDKELAELNLKLDELKKDKKVTAKKPRAPAVKQEFDWGNIGLTADHIKQIEEIKKAVKSPIKTQSAVTGLVNNLIKCLQAGFTLDYVLQEWADRGWKTVKAEWLLNAQGVNNGQNRPQQISQNSNTAGYDRNSTDW